MAVIDNYGPNEQAIITLFSAVFNKAPTPDLIALGASELANGATQGQILDLLFNYPDVPFTGYKASAPTNAFVTALIDNLTAGATISAETKASWVALLAPEVAGFANYGDFAATLVSLVTGITWDAGTELAALSANIDAKAEAAAGKSYNSTDTYTGWANLDGVTNAGDGEASDSSVLGAGADYLFGHDVYTAPLVQLGTLGNVSNSLDSGDTILGKVGGGGVLNADLTLTTTGAVPVGPAISSITNNIDKVFLRAQTGNVDVVGAPHGNRSHIDAERNVGVKEWWTQDSRASIQIEDVRTLPEDTTIGVRNTDPHVGFRVYFDPAQLIDRVSSQSIITLTLGDVDRPNSLEFVPIDGVGFYLDGEAVVLRSTAIGEAKTYAEFVAALNAAIAATPAAAGLVATLNADNSISVQDPAGGTFTKGGWQFIDNSVPADGNLFYTQEVGDPTLSTEPVTTGVILDAVGRTSQGGTVDIGSLGDGGVERFNVEVDRSSWVEALQSTEHLGRFTLNGQPHRHLEIVNFTSIGANGNVKVGDVSTVATGLSGLLDGRVHDGLVDVQEVNGAEFKGQLNLGITLTDDSVWRYLDGATSPVTFSYTGSAQNDLINLKIAEDVASDPDFRAEVDLGAGDDRLVFNADSGYLKNISLDGGVGVNTFVIADTDVAWGNNATEIANSTFASFVNFVNYEIEGGEFNHNFAGLDGVENVVIATDGELGGADTTLRNLPTSISTVNISGKNQTVDAYGNVDNSDQYFGDIVIEAAKSAELTVELNNTARVDGELDIDLLSIKDQNATNLSAVRVLNIESNGERDTSNEIDDLSAAKVNTFNISGTQDLAAYITAASNSTVVAPANRTSSFVVDASELTGDLALSVDADILTSIDASSVAGVVNSLTGTAGSSDVLIVRDGAVSTTADTTISGFETIRFLDAGNAIATAAFNAVNVSGVSLYDIRDTTAGTGDLTLINLRGANEVVRINADQAGALVGDVTLRAASNSGSGVSLQYRDADTDTLEANVNGSALKTGGFTTVNLDLATANGTTGTDYDLDLRFLDAEGNDYLVDAAGPANGNQPNQYNSGSVAARTVNVTGGIAADTADLGLLQTQLTLVDVSGYAGAVTGGWNSATSTSNAVVRVNANDFSWSTGNDFVAGTPEVQILDFAGAGDLEVGDSVTIAYAGGSYTFTNTTAAALNAAALVTAIDSATDLPAEFTVAANGNVLELTSASNGDVAPADNAVVSYTNLSNNTTQGDGVTVAQAADTFATEAQSITFNAAFGPLQAGDQVTINFDGDSWTYTNNTGAPIQSNLLANAIASQYSIEAGTPWADVSVSGNALVVTKLSVAANLPLATITATPAAANVAPVAVVQDEGVADVGAVSDFITTFEFTKDASALGNVWLVDGFQPILEDGVGLGNLSILDLSDLGVTGLAQLKIQNGDDFVATLGASAVAYAGSAIDGDPVTPGLQDNLSAGDVVITSNTGLKFTIVLTGVDVADLLGGNNFQFAA